MNLREENIFTKSGKMELNCEIFVLLNFVVGTFQQTLFLCQNSKPQASE